ncbi:MAG: hypothetical protein Q9N34_06190 [Aquificota bacterium]|nr:hypothetical protein [Aquificota bacterium]
MYLSFILAFPAGRHIFFSSLYYRVLLNRSWEEALRKGFIAGVIALFIFAVSCYALLTLLFISSGGRSW